MAEPGAPVSAAGAAPADPDGSFDHRSAAPPELRPRRARLREVWGAEKVN
jgi:hypothetical protein